MSNIVSSSRMLFVLATCAVLGLGFTTTPADATIITPTSATANSNIDGVRVLGNTRDGSGLNGVGDILSQTHKEISSSTADNPLYWLSAITAVDDDPNFRSTTAVLTFDLAAASDINQIHLWQYVRTSDGSRGIETFDISFSFDGGNDNYPTTISGVTLGNFLIGTHVDVLDAGRIRVQSKSFAGQSGVTNIRLSNIYTFGSTQYIGLSEIRFGFVVVPEPSTLALFPIGAAAIGLIKRRRG